MTTRAQAYLTAWAKTEGREFDCDGRPILTAAEREILKRADDLDYREGFQRAVERLQAKQRLAAIFRGEVMRN